MSQPRYLWRGNWAALPGETDFVTAGRYQRTINRAGVATGRFVYGKTYLARGNAVPIDPLALKLGTKTYQTRLLKGVFGALRDASPDHWGRRIIERHFGSPWPDELDYLLHSPDDRAGALGFGLGPKPLSPRRKFNRTLDLGKLQEFADAVIADDMEQTVRNRWYAICRREGVSEKDCETIRPAFAYKGVRLNLQAAS